MLLWTLGCMYLFKLVFLFSSNICPGVGLLDHMVVLVLVFWGTSILFSIVAAPTYIPTNSVGGFPFLHILTNICYLWSFWWYLFWQVWSDISLWFWSAFLWWLMMSNIFSYVCWTSVCLLWKMSIQVYFLMGLFVFLMLSCMNCLFWILAPYQSYHFQISSPIQ